ncbi:MAG TPA: hypothetical protein VEQ63_01740 [Bryobacteraceae bacterium]|nr:hypothetical protein [Bryobacteraceae bacterium]
MKRSTLAIAAYLMLVFGSGIVVGAFGHRLYTAREVSAARLTQPQGRMNPKDFRRKYSEELKTRLNLDAKQQATLQEILNDTEVRFREHNARTRPEAEKIKQHQREQIRAMLTPSQLPEYENILVERSRRNKDRK